MIPGNLNSKLTERQPKTTEKHNTPQQGQNYKKFGLRSNSDKGKSIDKKTFKSFAQNEIHIKTDVRHDTVESGKENDATNAGRGIGSPRLRSDGRREIKPGTTSAPVVAAISTVTRSSSVTRDKYPAAKETIKHTALKNVSNHAKKCDALTKTECNNRIRSKNNTSKIAVNSNDPALLEKSTTCPPCMKLQQGVNSFHPNRIPEWNSPRSPLTGCASGPTDKTRSLSLELTQRRTVKFTSQEKPDGPPKQMGVKRMKSEGDSIASRNARVSARTTSLLPRQATSEIKHFTTNNKCPEIRTDKESSIIKHTEKEATTGPHVQTADFAVTGLEIKNESGEPDIDSNESPKRDDNDPQTKLLGRSSLRTTDCCDSFDSIDGILSRHKRIYNDCEWEIRKTRDKTDFLHENEDDYDDSFSEIVRQLHFLNYEPGPDTYASVTASETRSKRACKSHSLDSNADKRISETERPRKNIHHPPMENPQLETEPIITYPKRAEELLREQGKREKSDKFGQVKERDSQPCTPSEFFQTHKNLGFIGKEEDEERVSFDPTLVTLYQPRETQMLLYDLANCIATQAYLRMCGINYVLAERKNAEHMSPSGKVPFVSSSLCIIPEFEGIVSFMQYKKYSCARIRECDKAAFRATVSMIVDTLEVAERYICWHDAETVVTYTKPRIGGLFPFPLNHVIYWKKRYEERKRLTIEDTKEPSFDEALRKISDCFNTLSQLLGNKKFFFGDSCTEIDALVYGHVYAAFAVHQGALFRHLQFIINKFPNLLIFACNFDKMFSLYKFSSLNPLPSESDFSITTIA